MTHTTYREALRAAHREALQRDPRVFVMGEDVGRYGGSYAVTKGPLDEFGDARIRDTPLSELGVVGAGIGAEGWRTCSLAAEILARVGEEAFFDLDAPPARVCSEEVPIPYG